MPNAPRPSECYPVCTSPCTSCGCSECGALVDRETLRPFPLPNGGTGHACAACLAEGEDTGGVPVEVEEEASGAQTVRLESDPTIRQTGRDWAEKLSQAVTAWG